MQVTRLITGEIHADGGIPENTPDLISGGVFVIYGAWVDRVENIGAVTTYVQMIWCSITGAAHTNGLPVRPLFHEDRAALDLYSFMKLAFWKSKHPSKPSA